VANRPFTPSGMTLPARANLEHLRHEAKKQLKEMLRQNAAATLSAAQLAVARRYGFGSWRKLKAYVDAVNVDGARIIQAVRSDDLITIAAVLDRHPELVNLHADLETHALRPSDAPAMRLIHLAVAENRRQVATLLVSRGANLNARNLDGRLPLHDCFELGRDDFAKYLLSIGAEPDICASAAYGLHDEMLHILEQDANQANDLRTGLSPLGWSVYGNQTRSAEILFSYGAEVNRAPFDVQAWGPTAHVANVGFARLLLAHGAEPNCRHNTSHLIGAADRGDGDTPIHIAIKSRLVLDPTEFVELLLAAGADPTLANSENHTPLDEAELHKNRTTETYFPPRPIGTKNLTRTIEILKEAVAKRH
jgi:hypothetical protein